MAGPYYRFDDPDSVEVVVYRLFGDRVVSGRGGVGLEFVLWAECLDKMTMTTVVYAWDSEMGGR